MNKSSSQSDEVSLSSHGVQRMVAMGIISVLGFVLVGTTTFIVYQSNQTISVLEDIRQMSARNCLDVRSSNRDQASCANSARYFLGDGDIYKRMDEYIPFSANYLDNGGARPYDLVGAVASVYGTGSVELLIPNEDSWWFAFAVNKSNMLNVGGEKIGEVYDWYAYNPGVSEIIPLNGKTVTVTSTGTGDGQFQMTVNLAVEWISENELVVAEDGGSVWNGVAVYNVSNGQLREMTQAELAEHGYSGLF